MNRSVMYFMGASSRFYWESLGVPLNGELMVARASSEFPPGLEMPRHERVARTLEERETNVRQLLEVLAELEQMGDSPADCCRRLQLRETLHGLAIPLWLDGPEDE